MSDHDELRPDTVRALSSLDPDAAQIPSAEAEYERWRSRAGRSSAPGRSSAVERFRFRLADLLAPRLRPALVGLAAVVVVAGSLAFAPARRAWGNVLSIFRVHQFSAFSIDKDHADKLKRLAESLRGGAPSAPQYDRQPGNPQPVADAAQASRLTGFAVRMPQFLPPGAVRRSFAVSQGPAMHFDFNREKIMAELDSVGLGGVTLPAMQSGTVKVDVGQVCTLSYEIPAPSGTDTTRVHVLEAATPAVSLPPGTDLQAWGESMFQVLGMPPEQARQMAQRIDWTSTLVVPLPNDAAAFRQVEVNGAQGLMVEENRRGRSHTPHAMLVWTQGDVVYSLHGEHILSSSLLEIAQSMR